MSAFSLGFADHRRRLANRAVGGLAGHRVGLPRGVRPRGAGGTRDDQPRVTVATEWGRAACALLAELAIYAGLAGGVSLVSPTSGIASSDGRHGRAAGSPGDGAARRDRGRGSAATARPGCGCSPWWPRSSSRCTTWPTCARRAVGERAPARVPPAAGGRRRRCCWRAPGGDARRARHRSLLGLLYILVRPSDTVAGDSSGVAGYRGDGPLSAWIGGFVDGRLPPTTPLLVGLLVTCMLAALGLRNLPGILVLTPAEAMLLAALGSSHLHDGRRDWRVPALLAGRRVRLPRGGRVRRARARHLSPSGLSRPSAMRHLDMAYRARNRVPLSWFMAGSGPGCPARTGAASAGRDG